MHVQIKMEPEKKKWKKKLHFWEEGERILSDGNIKSDLDSSKSGNRGDFKQVSSFSEEEYNIWHFNVNRTMNGISCKSTNDTDVHINNIFPTYFLLGNHYKIIPAPRLF